MYALYGLINYIGRKKGKGKEIEVCKNAVLNAAMGVQMDVQSCSTGYEMKESSGREGEVELACEVQTGGLHRKESDGNESTRKKKKMVG